MNCELRCHILDREDQLEYWVDSRKGYHKRNKALLNAISEAQEEYKEFRKRVDNREKFIALIESTLECDWIDRPDLLEKEWFNKGAINCGVVNNEQRGN